MGSTVAVVVRLQGDRHCLERALASVRAQTYDDWTLVVAAPDGERFDALVAPLADLPRVQVVRARGRGALANAALGKVEADFAVLHDDDGSWAPEFLERTVAFLEEHPGHVAVATRAEVVHEGVGPEGPIESRRELLEHEGDTVTLTSLLVSNHIPPSALVYRRDLHARIGGYDETLPDCEDWDFLLRLLVAGRIAMLPDAVLAAWHVPVTPGGATGAAAGVSEALVRDLALRRGLAEGQGLGLPLFIAHELRATADRYGRAHRDHLDVVTTELRLELGRMRGELLLQRELLDEAREDMAVLGHQLEQRLLHDQVAANRREAPVPGRAPARTAGARRAVRGLARRLALVRSRVRTARDRTRGSV
jgi:glycosyl transferase family 2